MAVEVIARKIGNSIGFILPKDEAEKEKIKPNQKFFIQIVKEADLSGIFGKYKSKMAGQEFKDMVRKGWD